MTILRKVYCFYCLVDELTEHNVMACEGYLLPGELKRYKSFVAARDAHCYLVAHVLPRWAAARLTYTDPKEWLLMSAACGKPKLSIIGDSHQFAFSLSHTRGMAMCALGDRPVGIDSERIHLDAHEAKELAQRYFSPRESARVAMANDMVAIDTFFCYWTLKEAFLKGTGEGLRRGMAFPSFSSLDDGNITLHSKEAEPYYWAFLLLGDERFRISLAVRSDRDQVGVEITKMDSWGRAALGEFSTIASSPTVDYRLV